MSRDYHPNGSSTNGHPDGSSTNGHPDGSSTNGHPDGSSTNGHPDGSSTNGHPDGSSTNGHPDGSSTNGNSGQLRSHQLFEQFWSRYQLLPRFHLYSVHYQVAYSDLEPAFNKWWEDSSARYNDVQDQLKEQDRSYDLTAVQEYYEKDEEDKEMTFFCKLASSLPPDEVNTDDEERHNWVLSTGRAWHSLVTHRPQ